MNQMLTWRVTLDRYDDIGLEAERIIDFYHNNSHKWNRIRDPLQIIKAVKTKKFYIIEDLSGNIKGISACFSFWNMYREIGGTRVIANSFGFQQLLLHCMILNELALDPVRNCIFSIFASDNVASVDNTQKCGFERWHPDDNFIDGILGIDDPAYRDEKIFLRLNSAGSHDALRNSAAKLMTLYDNPVVRSRKDGREVRIILDFPLMRNDFFRLNIVKPIAQGDGLAARS